MNAQRTHRRNYNIIGHAHELTFCCYKRLPFLKSDRTCLWLSDAINRARVELEFNLWAYVFMPDHVHVIVYPCRPKYDISDIRSAIKHPTSKIALDWLRQNRPDWLPRLTRSRGKRAETLFWQSGGGYDRNIEKPGTLIEMLNYIHLKPVRKGLVARPEEWKWSSAGQYAGKPNSVLQVDAIPADWLE